jgi:hypothetical protein
LRNRRYPGREEFTMKKVLLGLVGVVGLVVVGVVGAAAMQPDSLHVERSATIAASPADLGPYTSDLKMWAEWNPWRDMDPSMETTYSDTTAGPGAWYSWSGNEQVGKGKMEVLTVADDKVTHDLEFFEPWQSKATITFSFAADGDSTRVTWAMDENLQFSGKMAGLFMDMDAMLGADFDKGLAKLKPLAEATATARKDAEMAAVAAAEAAAAADPAAVGATASVTP